MKHFRTPIGLMAGIPLVGLVLSGCDIKDRLFFWEEKPREELLVVSEREKALQNAQASLDYFILCLRKRKGDAFLAKVLIQKPGKNPEVIWLSNVKRVDSQWLTGRTAESSIESGVKPGKTMRFARRQIVDWVVVMKDQTFGGFTEPAYRVAKN